MHAGNSSILQLFIIVPVVARVEMLLLGWADPMIVSLAGPTIFIRAAIISLFYFLRSLLYEFRTCFYLLLIPGYRRSHSLFVKVVIIAFFSLFLVQYAPFQVSTNLHLFFTHSVHSENSEQAEANLQRLTRTITNITFILAKKFGTLCSFFFLVLSSVLVFIKTVWQSHTHYRLILSKRINWLTWLDRENTVRRQ